MADRAAPVWTNHARVRILLLRFVAIAMLIGFLLPAAFRAEAARTVLSGYKHVSWSMENGAPSRINSIAQSTNGYLWMGGVDGLTRFDGVSFEQIRRTRAGAERLVVSDVLGARSGDVWVGLARGGGVAVYRGGRLLDARMPNPSREVNDLTEDRDGAVWVARGGRTRDTIARYYKGRWEEIGAGANLPAQQVWQILFARDGTMWVLLSETIMRRERGSSRFEPTRIAVTPDASLVEDRRGQVWLADAGKIVLLLPGTAGSPNPERPQPPRPGRGGGTKVLSDGHGRFWMTTLTDGIAHLTVPQSGGRIDTRDRSSFTSADGLTSDLARTLFEDREGNIWVGTEMGLDMLRRADVAVEPGIPANSPVAYRLTVGNDGVVYVTAGDTLFRIDPGAPPRAMLRTGATPGALCVGRENALWLVSNERLIRLRGRKVEDVPKPLAPTHLGCAEDREGRLWLSAADQGLLWRERGQWHRWPGLTDTVGQPGDTVLGPDGRAVILFRTSPGPQAGAPFIPVFRERFDVGNIEAVLPGRRSLFVGGARGLVRMKADRIRTLDAGRYPWLVSVNGLVQTPSGDTWTIGDAGIVRMRTAALDRAFDRPGAPLAHQIFDFRDGLESFAQKSGGTQVAAGADGRIWFLTRRNVLQIDPRRLSRNQLPPPVLIRFVADGTHRYRDPSAVTLSAGTGTVSIGYTALSLSVPSRVRFRYQLHGYDRDWVDPGARRGVTYAGLRPGKYRFRVIAANNDGVWNARGAEVSFTIPPTLTQTWPFFIACVALVALLLWLLYVLRVRRISAQIRARLEERVFERERIARELHDTLLQGVQGLIMRFQSVADHIPEGDPAKASIDGALERADQLLVEGRDRVRDLRTSETRGLDVILAELAQQQPFAPSTRIVVSNDGHVRALRPQFATELLSIAGEALFNAARHAEATLVEVQIDFGKSRLSIRIRDNGAGVAAERLARAGREGHYGIIGMHERAERMGASLVFSSDAGGTAITIGLPAAIAYDRPIARRSPLSRWLRGPAGWRRRVAGNGAASR